MSKKTLVISAIVILAIAALAVFVAPKYKYSLPPTIDYPVDSSTSGVYTSKDIGIEFAYPQKYQVGVRDNEEGAVRIITLLDKANLPVGQDTEGPPAINIERFDNPQNLALDQWVRTTPASNWHLSNKGELGASTVGGESGLGYTYSGLYNETAVAVAHGNKIYVFSVGTLTPEDQIKTDFLTLLGTVKFI